MSSENIEKRKQLLKLHEMLEKTEKRRLSGCKTYSLEEMKEELLNKTAHK